MKILYILILALSLSGCQTLRQKLCTDAVITDKVITVDPRYYEECGNLLRLSPNTISFEDILGNNTENALVYNDCRAKLHDNILLLKKLTNYKETK